MKLDDDDAARAAYEAFCRAMGVAVTPWSDLNEGVAERWRAAAASAWADMGGRAMYEEVMGPGVEWRDAAVDVKHAWYVARDAVTAMRREFPHDVLGPPEQPPC